MSETVDLLNLLLVITINVYTAENIKYFMYKYNFTYYDWFGLLHVILKKIECYVINSASTDDICAASAIRELQWWQKESGPSAILSNKEQTRVKRPNK